MARAALTTIMLLAVLAALWIGGRYYLGVSVLPGFAGFRAYLPSALSAAFILAGALLVRVVALELVNRWFANYPADATRILRSSITAVLLAAAGVLIVSILTHDPLVFSIALAAALLGVFYAMRGVLEDVALRFWLLANPFVNIGDLVVVEGEEGRVIEFGLIYTVLRRRSDNALVLIPNSHMVASKVVNLSQAPLHLRVQDGVVVRAPPESAAHWEGRLRGELEREGVRGARVEAKPFGRGELKLTATVRVEDAEHVPAVSKQVSKALARVAYHAGAR
jgi:small-conductance mechanosensitive channel